MSESGLALYDEACRLLAEARAVDEVKDYRDRADALRLYARQARNRTLEIDASEIRFRAERRIGELLDAQRATIGLAVGGRPKTGSDKTGSCADPVSPADPPTLAAIGIDKHLADRARRYAGYPAETFEAMLAERRTRIESERKRVTVNLSEDDDKAARRAAREAALAGNIRALPNERYGVILDDPEWRYEVWSRETGLDRAADNHYPTSTIEAIIARSEEIAATIAAPSCAWFRWVTVPFLALGLRTLEVGGFTYRSSWAWGKDRAGTGYWNRNKHEMLLLAVRGDVPCPAPGTQWESLLHAPVTKHSAKPECVLAMIEAYFPTLPKIELNRRGPARPGWAAWGNEAEVVAA